MARARPSQPAIKNVLEAILACGMVPGAIRVAPDGSFVVETQESDDQSTAPTQNAPRKFGERR